MASISVNSVGSCTISKDYVDGRYEQEYPYMSDYDYVYIGGHIGSNSKNYDAVGVFSFETASIKELYKSKVVNSLRVKMDVPYIEGGINVVLEPEKKIKVSLFGANTNNCDKITFFNFYSYAGDCIDSTTVDLICSIGGSIHIDLLELFSEIRNAIDKYKYIYIRFDEENTSFECTWRLWKIAILTVEYQSATSTIAIGYPNNVNVKNQSKITFMWSFSNNAGLKQATYEIGWKLEPDSVWNTITKDSDNKYHTFNENTFPSGVVQWRLCVTAEDGLRTGYVEAFFLSEGKTSAPVVTEITMTAIPTIKWVCDNQDMFEIEIYTDDNKRLYESGLKIGSDTREFTPNIMLGDGNYYVKMRAMNIYGYLTEWASYAWILSTNKPDRPKAHVSYGKCATIVIEGKTTTEKTYVIRKRESEDEFSIIGIFKGLFIDYCCTREKTEYALRAYDGGFSDSNAEEIKVDFPGIYLYEVGNEENNVNMMISTKDKFIPVAKNIIKETAYTKCIGRKYPVKECGENIEEVISTECFLYESQKDVLEDMYKRNADVLFKYDKEQYVVDIASMELSNAFFNQGYIAALSFERIESEGEVKLI